MTQPGSCGVKTTTAQFEAARRSSRGEAEDLATEMQARGHRQTYWVAAAR
jgi:hypothetical protein